MFLTVTVQICINYTALYDGVVMTSQLCLKLLTGQNKNSQQIYKRFSDFLQNHMFMLKNSHKSAIMFTADLH